MQHLGAAGRARTDGNGGGDAPDPVEQSIKAEQLRQLALSNQRAEAEAAARSRRYTLAEDAKQEMGRVAARLLAVFKSAFGEFANAMTAEKPQTQRDVVRTLRATWRQIRLREAKVKNEEAAAVPPLLDDSAVLALNGQVERSS